MKLELVAAAQGTMGTKLAAVGATREGGGATGQVDASATGSGPTDSAKHDGEELDRKGGTSKGLIIGGLVATGVAAVAGITFAIVSSVQGSKADERLTSLRQKTGVTSCSDAAVAADCVGIHETLSARDTFGELSFWSFVTGSVLGAGTMVYALAAPQSKSVKTVRAVPLVGGHGAGIMVSGAW